MKNIFPALIVSTCLLSACDHKKVESASSNASSQLNVHTIKVRETDKWLGKWIGPEGTFLEIATNNDHTYTLIIQNLDGPRTFQGISLGEQIEFERDGSKEIIRASNGAETGMKWLSDKSTCLTVKVGEGYCKN